MKIKEGYKVLFLNRGRLRSAVYPYSLTYKRRSRTFPRKGEGPLCVFPRLFDAMSFKVSDYNSLKIYRVRYEPSRGKRVWMVRRDGKVLTSPLVELSAGKALARWVELLEEVK